MFHFSDNSLILCYSSCFLSSVPITMIVFHVKSLMVNSPEVNRLTRLNLSVSCDGWC